VWWIFASDIRDYCTEEAVATAALLSALTPNLLALLVRWKGEMATVMATRVASAINRLVNAVVFGST